MKWALKGLEPKIAEKDGVGDLKPKELMDPRPFLEKVIRELK